MTFYEFLFSSLRHHTVIIPPITHLISEAEGGAYALTLPPIYATARVDGVQKGLSGDGNNGSVWTGNPRSLQ